MRILLRMLFMVLLLLPVSGCRAEHLADNKGENPDRPNIIYPTGRALKFNEDQVIKKQVQVTRQWQTITFGEPLQINREGLQHLHLAIDQKPYISTMHDHPLNPECNKPGCEKNAFSLRRLGDGALVRPEVILVGDNGDEVRIRPVGHLYPYFDKSIRTIELGTFALNAPPPPFPAGINGFKSMRIRSTEPFVARYLWWSVDRHAKIFNR